MSDDQEGASTFQVEAGVLKVNRELDEIEPEELVAAIRKLADTGVEEPVVDLGDHSYLPSYHISGIREVGDECVRSGRSLTVRARRNVTTLLERMGLNAALRLRQSE